MTRNYCKAYYAYVTIEPITYRYLFYNSTETANSDVFNVDVTLIIIHPVKN